jgi:surfactin synthase thioesterase subunit/acyl carrier protein
VGFCTADWRHYVGTLPQGRPFLDDVTADERARAPADTGGPRADWSTQIRSLPAGPEALLAALRSIVTAELGFEDPIDVAQPINQLGVDSLMSVSLANRLERELKLPVPLIALLQGPTLEQLAQHLGQYLPADGGADAAPATSQADAAASPVVKNGSSGRWIVRLRRGDGPRVRLFCFPYAGAGATSYQPWADLLHPSIELVAIDPPGRGTRVHEPAISSMQSFVDSLLPELLPHLDVPSAFFGHCMGGLTLFETVRRMLARRGASRPAHVFLSGTRTPHGPRTGSFETALFRELLRHREYNPLVRLPGQSEGVFAAALRSFDIDATDDWLSNGELRAALLPAIRADFRLSEGYRPPRGAPWDTPITVFVGASDPYVSRGDALTWSEYTKQSFTLHVRPADHFMIATDREFIVNRINETLAGTAPIGVVARNGGAHAGPAPDGSRSNGSRANETRASAATTRQGVIHEP